MTNATLALHEERAQHGIIEFAEEMQIIRDENLYPGAKQEPDAWKTYCRERWAMSESTVNRTIQALPVLKRLTTHAVRDETPSVAAAASVATLPEPVQDAILTESPKRDEASDKAKAVRKAKKKIEQDEGREATNDELVAVARTPISKPKKSKPKHRSRFTGLLAQAVALTEDAADFAQSNVLSDIENEYAWNRVEKLRYHTNRIADMLHRPEHVRDIDEEFEKMLVGEDS